MVMFKIENSSGTLLLTDVLLIQKATDLGFYYYEKGKRANQIVEASITKNKSVTILSTNAPSKLCMALYYLIDLGYEVSYEHSKQKD